jgi:predicted regulator of Ras-like GTPase activity (Roadblock/LC7/MglB family)
MFGSLTRIFKRSASKQQEAAASSPFAAPREQGNANAFTGAAAPAPAEPELVVPSSSDSVVLPFSTILKLLPRELYGKSWASPGAAHFTISKSQVLEQLAHGTVKVPFGELRQAAPAGLLVNSSTHDGKLIELPLGEIMRQVQLESFSKRNAQKRVEVPAEITDLFGQKGEPITAVRVIGKKEAAAAAASTTTFRAKAPVSAGTAASGRGGSATPVVAPPPPVRMPQTPIAFSSAPAVGAKKAAVVTATVAAPKAKKEAERSPAEAVLVVPLTAISEQWPDAIRSEISQLSLANATCELPLSEIGPSLRAGKVQCRWKQIRSWVQPPISNFSPSNQAETMVELPLKILAPLYVQHCRTTRAPKKAAVAQNIPDVFNRATPEPVAPEEVEETTFELEPEASAESAAPEPAEPLVQPLPTERAAYLALPLGLVSENWPEQVRKEIDFFNLSAAKLEIPFEVIEDGLKQGRLNFRWRQICLWLNPPPSSEMASANLATQLDFRIELPLSFIAPLYLQQRSAAAGAKKQGVEPTAIPDVISREETPVSDEAAEEDSSPAIPAALEFAPAAKAARGAPAKSGKKSGEQLAELLGEPNKRNWTPNDIVHKTATLAGVSGALIALQDGLLVAACMPPNWKPETVAAFLPQIFGRMRQYTNEFKAGDLQNLSFTVPEGTLQVYSAGIIYFAALGKVDRELPLAELSLIAKEIGRHTKQ